ncbi:MAG: hypothetical protein ABS934_03480 [Psychrobacillus sp.]
MKSLLLIMVLRKTILASEGCMNSDRPIMRENRPIIVQDRPIMRQNRPIIVRNRPIIAYNRPIIKKHPCKQARAGCFYP